MTVARLWRTRIDLSRAEEYERFAQSVSLEMFRSQPGFVAVTMYRRAEECAVLTLWETEAAAAALDCAESYLRTVAQINASGFLRPPQSVEVSAVHVFHAKVTENQIP
ncbi:MULTISPECIES: hypothetical protein [Variovorax]|uniref:hypothetical protein n=1 Tax=Variovorax TaxID=34072 RepID=UPI00285D4A3F|nr:hypothetical protein [Variovorax sp. 3319]MDR6890962.1 heme-degrading monooxygenase HmoA [Variovorax sp. 3319]